MFLGKNCTGNTEWGYIPCQPPTCKDPKPLNTDICGVGCVCKKGFVLDANGNCVKPKECNFSESVFFKPDFLWQNNFYISQVQIKIVATDHTCGGHYVQFNTVHPGTSCRFVQSDHEISVVFVRKAISRTSGENVFRNVRSSNLLFNVFL